jgi:hypothetical protein
MQCRTPGGVGSALSASLHTAGEPKCPIAYSRSLSLSSLFAHVKDAADCPHRTPAGQSGVPAAWRRRGL